MAIAKITAAQFETLLQSGILSRNSSLDVTTGPIRDTVIAPVGSVLESQNDRIRRFSLIMSLLNVAEFTEAELDEYAFNEEIIRSQGVRATGTVIFQARVAPTADITVPINFPISTATDPTLGRTIAFRTTETRTLPAATAALFFNTSTQFYELEVAIQAIASGTDSNVAAGRINTLQAALSGFDFVTNRASTSGGTSRETNEREAERLLIAIPGTDISTSFGISRDILAAFTAVSDIELVFGIDPLLTRAASNAGAVDAYVIGSTPTTFTEAYTFLGVGQPIVLLHQPVLSVASVTAGGPAFIQNTDYRLVVDAGVNAGSIRAQDAVVFIAGGASPAIGSILSVVYNANTLMQTLQDAYVVPDHLVFGRDLLFKVGQQINIEVAANVSFLAGTNATSGLSLALSTIVAFVNALGLGDDVEQSDVNAAVRGAVRSVDNIVFSVFRVVGSGAAPADIVINKNQFARTTSASVLLVAV